MAFALFSNESSCVYQTRGFLCVGTPVGHPCFIEDFMKKRLEELKSEFQKLLPYPHPHDFLLLVRYCCNQKIMHLLRHLPGPQILDFAKQFDSIIEKLLDSFFDLHLLPDSPLDLSIIPSNLPSLTVEHMTQPARFLLRVLSADGCLDLLSMSEVAIPAFYAAHIRHGSAWSRMYSQRTSADYILVQIIRSVLLDCPFCIMLV